MLFVQPHEELTDDEVADVLRQSIANAGRLPRHADLFLASICAEHLVDSLRAAGSGDSSCAVATASMMN
jgi:hypothetical protein